MYVMTPKIPKRMPAIPSGVAINTSVMFSPGDPEVPVDRGNDVLVADGDVVDDVVGKESASAMDARRYVVDVRPGVLIPPAIPNVHASVFEKK